MSPAALDRIHAVDGIAVPNFFNGRILSAEDLRMLLEGDRAHRRLLGRAIGQGVAAGLRVTRSASRALTVSAGLAINGHGESIDLPADVELALDTSAAHTPAAAATGVFLDCAGPPSGSGAALNTFVLTVRPDSTIAGSAPADIAASGASCGPGYVREGVRFRTVAVDATALWGAYGPGSIVPTTDQNRNVLAHLFLSSWAWREYGGDPFDPTPVFDLVMADIGVDTCEVPIASFRLSGSAVQQLDMWGVRRRLHRGQPLGPGAAIEYPATDVRRALGEATFHQFQHQLSDTLAGTGAITATDRFPFLPAAGLLPADVLGTTTNPATFAAQPEVPFFAGVPHETHPEPISADRVEDIVRRGTEMPAIHPAMSLGTPIQVALIEQAGGADPYAVFFCAEHSATERRRIGELLTRIEHLEARLKADPNTGPSVTVIYRPGKQHVVAGVRIYQATLGDTPELAAGESGLLQFDVLASKTGPFRLKLVVSGVETWRVWAQAQFLAAGDDQTPNPHTRTINGGTIAKVLVQVSVSAWSGYGSSGYYANLARRSGDGSRTPEFLVTLDVASESDPTVKDAASVAIKVVP